MVGNLGGGSLMRYTVIGIPVNLASRLLGLAKDGEIVISNDVYLEVHLFPEVHVRSESDVRLKGIDAPQTIYHLESPQPIRTVE